MYSFGITVSPCTVSADTNGVIILYFRKEHNTHQNKGKKSHFEELTEVNFSVSLGANISMRKGSPWVKFTKLLAS